MIRFAEVNKKLGASHVLASLIGDVTKTGNGERGAGNGERGTGNGERK